MRKIIKRVLIVLNLQEIDSPGLVSFLRAIVKGLTNNPNITSGDLAKLPVTTADMLLQASALEATHISRKTNKSASLTAQEQDQATTVMNTITDTAHFVQDLANRKAGGDSAVAVLIITSVGFQVKKEFVQHQRSFEVVSTSKTQVHLRTVAVGQRVAYLWQWSIDDGKTWVFPFITIGSEIIITNLSSGTNYMFRFAIVVPIIQGKPTIAAGSTQLVWSDVITVIIP